MTKREFMKIFIDEINSEAPKENHATNKVVYNHIDDMWSIDFAFMIDYETSNNK